jgi:Protein of unknown function (DUF998)
MTATLVSAPTTSTCDPAARVTRSLLGYGVLAGPVYVTVSLVQAITRPGFDVTRHSWSLLSNGSLGWIQITNFVVTGLMIVAAAIGMRRALDNDSLFATAGLALHGGTGARWVPRLVGAFGVALVAAGLLRADPAQGFPVGTPDGIGAVSWHGIAHLAAGGVGFGCVIAACFVLARRFAGAGRRGLAVYCRVSGALFLAAFVGIASGNSAPGLTLGFVAGVLVIFTWLAAMSIHLSRATSA